ncbi:MAG: helix-turn-helix domain-containing protein [Xenophilus sp.]
MDAILDASARILGSRGWAGFTTNAAAEAAGVSIGSLYQYFPNKLALAEAVRLRHLNEVLSVLRTAANGKMTRAGRIEALADGLIAVHSRYPAAHRVLLEESPRGEDSRGAHDFFETEFRKGYEEIIAMNSRRTTHAHISAQVLAGAAAGAVHHAARQGTLALPEFRQELIVLIQSYLSKR